MSVFKTKWIILKIDKIKPWEFLYTIFTLDYWKIKCNKKLSKSEKPLDLWYLINFEIVSKESSSIHKIRNIKIKSEFDMQNKSFEIINSYLTILYLVFNKTPDWNPVFELFDLLEILNNYKDINNIKLILIKLKIISIFWELWENNPDPTINKILKFINTNKIDRILMLSGINKEIEKKLEIWIAIGKINTLYSL